MIPEWYPFERRAVDPTWRQQSRPTYTESEPEADLDRDGFSEDGGTLARHLRPWVRIVYWPNRLPLIQTEETPNNTRDGIAWDIMSTSISRLEQIVSEQLEAILGPSTDASWTLSSVPRPLTAGERLSLAKSIQEGLPFFDRVSNLPGDVTQVVLDAAWPESSIAAPITFRSWDWSRIIRWTSEIPDYALCFNLFSISPGGQIGRVAVYHHFRDRLSCAVADDSFLSTLPERYRRGMAQFVDRDVAPPTLQEIGSIELLYHFCTLGTLNWFRYIGAITDQASEENPDTRPDPSRLKALCSAESALRQNTRVLILMQKWAEGHMASAAGLDDGDYQHQRHAIMSYARSFDRQIHEMVLNLEMMIESVQACRSEIERANMSKLVTVNTQQLQLAFVSQNIAQSGAVLLFIFVPIIFVSTFFGSGVLGFTVDGGSYILRSSTLWVWFAVAVPLSLMTLVIFWAGTHFYSLQDMIGKGFGALFAPRKRK